MVIITLRASQVSMLRSAKGRPPVRQEKLLLQLRQQIVVGVWPAATRLPTRLELCRTFAASTVTMQQALDRLAAEGFVEARGSSGTFVTDRPPHRYAVALVFPEPVRTTRQNRFWAALEQEALSCHDSEYQLDVLHGINGQAGSPAMSAAESAVRRHLYGGLIFATTPFMLRDNVLLTQPGLARVAFMTPNDTLPDLLCVRTGMDSFARKAVDYLVARGRRRIALVTVPTFQMSPFTQSLSAHGVRVPEHWHQRVSLWNPECVQNVMQLMFRPEQPDRPDGLIIADDNLVEPATRGLVAAGIQVPETLDVVAHCNFPWPTPSLVPARRLGFDASQVLQASLDLIRCQLQGQAPVPHRVVPALFEDEQTPSSRRKSHSAEDLVA